MNEKENEIQERARQYLADQLLNLGTQIELGLDDRILPPVFPV